MQQVNVERPWVVNLEYRVPVVVTVNLVTGEVERVVVDDEGYISDPKRFDAVNGELLDPDDYKAANVIADREPWPAWEVGF